jgi:2-phospho-L-lactate guanylyltransferase
MRPVWAIVPVKPFDEAKSRLESVLDATARGDLARSLMRHSIRTLRASPGVDHVLVVSSQPEVLALAAELGATALEEAGGGLNPALEQARDHAVEAGAGSVMVVAGDLPFLAEADVAALLEAASDADVVIAGDRDAVGTNALLLRPPASIAFRFGESSLQRHRELAAEASLTVSLISRPGLAFDVDLPRDWLDLQAMTGEGSVSTPS